MTHVTRSQRMWGRRALQLLLAGLLLTATVSVAAARAFPETIQLPLGFHPEGIATGRGTAAYVGSLGRVAESGGLAEGGAIYKFDLRTGEGKILVPQREGRTAVGLTVDVRTNYVWAAGGPFGTVYVYNGTTGTEVAAVTLNEQPFATTFINDVFVTRDAAYLTDSFRPFLYRVPLGPGGRVPDPVVVEEIELGPGFEFIPGGFNANGIDATPNGKWLILVNSTTGALYRVDPMTGEAWEIDLGGEAVPAGDGILLDGKTLYVVQNSLNQIAVVELGPKLAAGEIVGTITDDDFRFPTTVAGFGHALYAVNARFDESPPPFFAPAPLDPPLEYHAVRVLK